MGSPVSLTRHIGVVLLLAVGAVTATGMAAPPVAQPTHTKSNQIMLTLPPVKHSRTATSIAHIPRALPGYYAWVQVAGQKGKYSPSAGPRRPLIVKQSNGKKLFSITLRTRYNSLSGRLRVRLVLKNISVRRKHTRVRARVTLGWS